MELKKRFSIVYLTRDDWTQQQQVGLEASLDFMCEGMGLTMEVFYNYSEPAVLGLVPPESMASEAMTKVIPETVEEILVELMFDSDEVSVGIGDLASILNFLDCSGAVLVEQVLFGSDEEDITKEGDIDDEDGPEDGPEPPDVSKALEEESDDIDEVKTVVDKPQPQ